ncbi:unnamed protein product [Rhizoctonia solani]|uniref:MYND-type domain-containing protein n=1 Tax=Rhizoctonia solani TaxID=456999 RepID=A0A8H3C2I8_9AGAM|nr:unnamed protein product [Rhizoctonia solani]
MANSEYHRWGLPIQSYPKLYTRDAIAAHFQTSSVLTNNADWRSMAITTISDICKLVQTTRQNPSVETISARITLQMLKSVLELTRYPLEYENFALPSLVAGSAVLMSSVHPTPFSYEYGYLCFRILVFSLNTCLINHGRNLGFTIRRMSSAPPGTHLGFFWDGAADLIAGELSPMIAEKRLTHILNPRPPQVPVLERSKIDMLLKLIHKDQKNFLVALMTADSLQLSGLMFLFYKYLEIERITRKGDEYTQKLFLPFSRIFRRYRLVFPEINHETDLTRLIYTSLPTMSDLQDKMSIDLDDSRNIIHAYNRCMKTSQAVYCKDAIHFMGFVAPLFAPGCEYLLPSLLESTFWMLWNTWSRSDIDTLVTVVQGYGVCFWHLFENNLKPLPLNPEPWRFELVEAIMKSDILEFVFRVALMLSEYQIHSTGRVAKARIKDFLDTMISFWEKATDYTPNEHFGQRMMKSGAIDYWFTLFTNLHERLYTTESSALDSIVIPFSMIFSRAVAAILGRKWRDMQFGFQVSGRCNYPRCPYPTNASAGCSKCMNATYCSPRCLAKDWSNHAPVCAGGDNAVRH